MERLRSPKSPSSPRTARGFMNSKNKQSGNRMGGAFYEGGYQDPMLKLSHYQSSEKPKRKKLPAKYVKNIAKSIIINYAREENMKEALLKKRKKLPTKYVRNIAR